MEIAITPAELSDLRDFLAVEVMGWIPRNTHYWHGDNRGPYAVMRFKKWQPDNPTTGHVWLLVERMRELGWWLSLDETPPNEYDWFAKFGRHSELNGAPGEAYASNPCLAICLAARAAMEATQTPE